MALSAHARRQLGHACKDVGAANEIGDAVDANTSGGATLAGSNTFAGASTFTGGVTVTTNGVTITDVNVVLSTGTGSKIGTATGQKLGFHNATPTAQRSGADQAALVAITGGESPTEAEHNLVITLVNELRAALAEKGLIKGAA